MMMLIRYDYGEKNVWSVVHVPSPEAEDKRHLHRQLGTLKPDRTRHIDRIEGLLAGQGVRLPVGTDFLERLEKIRSWDGTALLLGLRSRHLSCTTSTGLGREYAGWEFVNQQVEEVEAERTEAIRTSDDPSVEKVRKLLLLRGLGDNSTWLFVMEFFGWREFRNRRQVGGLAGDCPRRPIRAGTKRKNRASARRATAPSVPHLYLHYKCRCGDRDCLGLAATPTGQ